MPVRPNRLSLVTFQTNRYSVPVEWAHHSLFLRAFVDRVEISNGSRILRSTPFATSGNKTLHPFHYLPLLRERPGSPGSRQAAKELAQASHSGPVPGGATGPPPPAGGHPGVCRVLELCSRHPLHQVAQGVEQALLSKSLSSDTVAYFLNTDPGMTDRPVPIPLTRPLAGPSVQERDLRHYDLLLGRCS